MSSPQGIRTKMHKYRYFLRIYQPFFTKLWYDMRVLRHSFSALYHFHKETL